MALNSLAKYTIANGARDLNEDIHTIGTPTWTMFDRDENMMIEPGDVASGSVLYKDEMFQLGDPGSRDTIGDEFLDPYEHFELPWAYSLTYINLAAREIQRNLGRFQISDLEHRNDVLRNVPSGSRNTLVNMLAPRFRNMRRTLIKNCARHFFKHLTDEEGRESPQGIDVITTPDTEYANLGYSELDEADWKSALMGTFPLLWNPLHKHLTRDISIQDYIAAGDDIAAMEQMAEKPMKNRPWTVFLMSRNRYTQTLEWPAMAAEFEDQQGNTGSSQRRRSSSDDVELGATDQFVHKRLRMKFYTDPTFTDDKTVYFWKQGVVKKRMQYKHGFPDLLDITRSWNQKILKVSAEIEYQYLCTQRCSTGRITTTQGLGA